MDFARPLSMDQHGSQTAQHQRTLRSGDEEDTSRGPEVPFWEITPHNALASANARSQSIVGNSYGGSCRPSLVRVARDSTGAAVIAFQRNNRLVFTASAHNNLLQFGSRMTDRGE